MNPYRVRTLPVLEDLIRHASSDSAASGAPCRAALDFGSGDGWFASRLAPRFAALTAVDVVRRDTVLVEPRLYDGGTLPFPDRAFDLAYSVDVVHHCPDPGAALAELARCARSWLLLKDHTYRTPAGFAALCVLDELGNRRFGIPSPRRYQRGWEWERRLEVLGFSLERRVHPLACHAGALGALTNRLQFAALFRRVRG